MRRKTFLITAGPTQEPIDPVRYLTNHSSGKMGYALAQAAKKLRHHVLLISGPTQLPPPPGIKFISVTTAAQMYQAVMKNFKKADVIIKVAAVADYRVQKVFRKKIKKKSKYLVLKLVQNLDILKELGKKKSKNQILVGFAAETHEALKYAQKKLKEKNCDYLILNNVAKKGIGFGSDKNSVVILSKKGNPISLPPMPKTKLAFRILNVLNSPRFSG